MKIEDFLTPEQEENIARSIAEAERRTSGEIKVHIDRLCPGDALERAEQVFAELELFKTAFRNAVVIYLAVEDHKLAIFGDEAIHEKVGTEFWQEEINLIVDHFRRGERQEGISAAISQIGEKLSEFFPFEQKGDTNELGNEISYGKDE
jgi:uncharacterized membrane protein